MCRTSKSKNSPDGARGDTEVPSGDAGVPAPSGRDEGGRTRPKKLINALEHIETRLEQRVEITHPRGLEEPRRAKTQSCSTRQRRQPLGTYKGPAGRAHHRDTAPGDPRGELEASRAFGTAKRCRRQPNRWSTPWTTRERRRRKNEHVDSRKWARRPSGRAGRYAMCRGRWGPPERYRRRRIRWE